MSINQLKIGAILTYASIGISSLISLAYTPVMLRLLGQSDYGLYSLVSSVVAYLGLFNFGFGSAYVKFYARYKTQKDASSLARLNGMFMIIFLGLGILAVAAGLLLVFYSGQVFGNELTQYELIKAKTLTIIMVINTAITFPAIVFNCFITANEKFIFQKSLVIIKSIISPLVIIPVLLGGYGSVGMAITITIIGLTIEIINAWYCFHKAQMRFIFSHFDTVLLKELVIFSSFIFMNLVVNQINWNVDRFIVGYFRGTLEVAIYSLAGQLNTYFLTFSTAISNVYIPRVNEMVAKSCSNWELTELFTRLGRLQFIVLALVIGLLVFFGKPFITLWAGVDYSQSYYIALLLIIPVTIPLIQNLGIEIQRAKNQHKFRSWIYLLIAIINIAISIPLVKMIGGIGAALGTAIALVVGNVIVMNWYYHTKIGLDMRFFFLQIFKLFPSLIPPTIYGVGAYLFFDFNIIHNFVIHSVIFILIYAVSFWHFGLNNYEKELIVKPVYKLLKLGKTHA